MTRLRIAMITGSYPPMRCGVGDYTHRLVEAIRDRETDADIFTSWEASAWGPQRRLRPVVRKWNTWHMVPLRTLVNQTRPHIVHIQYPTLGYGYRLGPQALLMLLRSTGLKVVATIHEFQWAHVLRKISLIPFLVGASALIFTSDEERTAVAHALPWLRTRLKRASYVIPVGSNIPVDIDVAKEPAGSPVAAFFGLFYPGRQVELVVKAFSRAAIAHPTLKFRFIGDTHPDHPEYLLDIRRLIEKTLQADRVEWVLGKTPEECSMALAQCHVSVLPYPDGASFRRTTFIAALSLGVPVITTKGSSTPAVLADGSSALFAETESHMAELICRVATDPALSRQLSQNGRAMGARFSWDQIAEAHLEVYNRVWTSGGWTA